MQKKPKYLPMAEMSLQEVAESLGTTRAAVAEIERNALRKLRLILKERGITLQDFFTWTKE